MIFPEFAQAHIQELVLTLGAPWCHLFARSNWLGDPILALTAVFAKSNHIGCW